jgi:hypothetical protein
MNYKIRFANGLREWTYDRQSPIANLHKNWMMPAKYNLLVVNMKNDWKRIYPFDK